MSGKLNVYENIVVEIKRLIESGAMPNGEKLPSVRSYALERKVNPNTVARAYAALEEEGYICVLPKKGGYVCFGETDSSQDKKELKRQLTLLKEQGVRKEELLQAIQEIYGEEEGI